MFSSRLQENISNIDDLQCSDRRCRETHFYSDPLDSDIAEAIIESINNTPLLAESLLSPSQNQHSFKYYPGMNLSHMVTGSSPLRPLRNRQPLQSQSINHEIQPSPPSPLTGSQSQLLTTTNRPQGGIFCANSDCNPRAHSRRQGNTDCTECLCLNCCQRAAAEAVAAHRYRARCPVRSHRSEKKGLSTASIAALPSSRPIEQLIYPHASSSTPVSANNNTIPIIPSGLTNLRAEPLRLVAQDLRYAQPLPRMWQDTTPEWLEAKREASKEDMAATGRKKAAAITKVVQRQMVNAIIWTDVSDLSYFPMNK